MAITIGTTIRWCANIPLQLLDQWVIWYVDNVYMFPTLLIIYQHKSVLTVVIQSHFGPYVDTTLFYSPLYFPGDTLLFCREKERT